MKYRTGEVHPVSVPTEANQTVHGVGLAVTDESHRKVVTFVFLTTDLALAAKHHLDAALSHAIAIAPGN